jgi:hypothetical protein
MIGSIYRRCLRAFIYLGEDIIRSNCTSNRSYRTRHELEEFGNKIPASVLKLDQLLELRYFQRVWVIQEVIQAPRVVIPILSKEFMVGPLTASRINKLLKWSGTGAPWMLYACTGMTESETTLPLMLQHTALTGATGQNPVTVAPPTGTK